MPKTVSPIMLAVLLMSIGPVAAETGTALNGVWRCAEMIEEGKSIPCADEEKPRLTIWGNRYVVSLPDGTIEMQMRTGPQGRIDLTPTAGVNRGKNFPGLYEITGDTLVISYAPVGGRSPSNVSAAANPGGRVVTWSRVDQKRQAMTGETVRNSIGMVFKLVLPSTYVKGATPREPARLDETRHVVVLTRPFYLGVYEVTVGQFEEFVRAKRAEDPDWKTEAERDQSPSGPPRGGQSTVGRSENWWNPDATWTNPGFRQGRNHPVVFVSWNDAQEFCKWLSRKEGKNYRLPTEAEWELVARAGTTTAYWWGDSIDGAAGKGNFADKSYAKVYPKRNFRVPFGDGYVHTAPVGRFTPNPWGFHDMLGNVWEWVANYYEAMPSAEAVTDPTGPQQGTERVAKGGGWANRPDEVRAAFRFRDEPSWRFAGMGFRVLLDID